MGRRKPVVWGLLLVIVGGLVVLGSAVGWRKVAPEPTSLTQKPALTHADEPHSPPAPDVATNAGGPSGQSTAAKETSLAASGLYLLRLQAAQATSARQAVDAALSLPPGDPDQINTLGEVAQICRRGQISTEESYFEGLARNGLYAQTPLDRSLYERWFSANRRFCGEVSSASTLAILSAQRAAAASGPPSTVQDDELFLKEVLAASDGGRKGFAEAVREINATERLWSMIESSESPEIVKRAANYLALAGDWPFADDPSLTSRAGFARLLDGNPSGANYATQLRVAAAQLFYCREFGVCGPTMAASLNEPWTSELHAATGLDGYFRSTLSPNQWEKVDALAEQLRQRRRSAATGG